MISIIAQKRFWAKVKVEEDGCWIWQAYKNTNGYGWLAADGKHYLAHRVTYELYRGELPKDLDLDHLCRNRACVNPYHLEVVTHRENLLRGECPSAIHAKKTHCPKGHPYEGSNLEKCSLKVGQRVCVTCRNERNHEVYRKNKSVFSIRNRKYRETHVEEIKEYQRQYRLKKKLEKSQKP